MICFAHSESFTVIFLNDALLGGLELHKVYVSLWSVFHYPSWSPVFRSSFFLLPARIQTGVPLATGASLDVTVCFCTCLEKTLALRHSSQRIGCWVSVGGSLWGS